MPERSTFVAFGNDTSGPRRLAGVAMLAALAAWVVDADAADIYKCVVDGTTTYQDEPCGKSGTVIRTDTPATQASRANAAADSVARLRANVTALEQARRARDAAAEIERLERESDALQKSEQDELEALRQEERYASYNAIAAPWDRTAFDERIAKQRQAINDKYTARRQALRERIEELRRSAEAAPPTPVPATPATAPATPSPATPSPAAR